jgi:osmoprotectant transport system substrate-binding protein
MAGTVARALLAFSVALVCMAVPAGASLAKITVASKVDTEGALLGSMILELLQRRGLDVESKLQLGPTRTVRSAIISGDIDIYPEYTGNAGFFSGSEADPVWRNASAGFERAREIDADRRLIWLKPAPANNTWAIALRRDVAKANGIRTLDDFSRWVGQGGRVKLAGSQEFLESSAALPAFQKAYGFTLSPEQTLVLSGGDTAATIRAAAQNIAGVNAAMAYGTDGELAALDLVILEDTRQVQPVYAPAPVVRAEILKQNPEIRDALEPVFATLDKETLQQLNARIALDGMDARTVARDYLTAHGFIPPAATRTSR